MFNTKTVLPVRGLSYKVNSENHNSFTFGPFFDLKPEENNSYDKFAVSVHYGEKVEKVKIGYLPKEENEFYHQFLLAGGSYNVRLSHINKESTNHAWDYLFIEITINLTNQSEFELFVKFNKSKEVNNLKMDRWINKSKKKRKHFNVTYTEFTPPQPNVPIYGQIQLLGTRKVIKVLLKEISTNKYKILEEEWNGKWIKVDDDTEYECL